MSSVPLSKPDESPPDRPGSPDAELASRSVLEALYDASVGRAFAVAWAIVGTKSGAEAALVDGTVDFWRHCTDGGHDITAGGWLCCVSTHALDDRRHGFANPGPLSGLTDVQCQLIALIDAGAMSTDDIAREMELSPTTVDRTLHHALLQLEDEHRHPHVPGPTPARGVAPPSVAELLALARPARGMVSRGI